MELHQVIKRSVVTEKAMAQPNQYVFAVDCGATKGLIRAAVTQFFKVHVVAVNTTIFRGKKKRVGQKLGKKSNWKKAFVTLKEGEKIELHEGV